MYLKLTGNLQCQMFLYEEGQLAVEISHAMSFSFLWKQMGCFQLLVVLIKKVFRYGKTQNPQKNVFRKIFPREIFTERTLRDILKHFFFAKGQGNTIKDLQGKLKCWAFPEILTVHFQKYLADSRSAQFQPSLVPLISCRKCYVSKLLD